MVNLANSDPLIYKYEGKTRLNRLSVSNAQVLQNDSSLAICTHRYLKTCLMTTFWKLTDPKTVWRLPENCQYLCQFKVDSELHLLLGEVSNMNDYFSLFIIQSWFSLQSPIELLFQQGLQQQLSGYEKRCYDSRNAK